MRLVLLLTAAFALLARYGAPGLVDEPAVAEEAWVDPAGLSFDHLPDWVDPRWIDALELAAVGHEPFTVGDRAALAALGASLEELPFVERLEELSADRRRGLSVEVTLRRPAACIPSGGAYLLVSSDGVVLPGRWEKPPRCGAGYLPVIGPAADAELFAYARPGDWLADPAHLDALDVARSMRVHLDDLALRRLGRVLIDASTASRASVDEPGVRIHLEHKRLCLFGRIPSTPEPGELPAAVKWASLGHALQLLEADPPKDWELVDCRWDLPDLRLAALPPQTTSAQDSRAPVRPRTSARRGEPTPETRGPRVR